MADLKHAYRALDPAQPAQKVQHYVLRPGDPIGVLAEELKLRATPLHVLVGGQRGVGKSTELRRLANALREVGMPCILAGIGGDHLDSPELWLGALGGGIATAHGVFMEDRQLLTRGLLVEGFLEIANAVGAAAGHPMTVLVDGSEKLTPEHARGYVTTLGGIPCSFVMVAPIPFLRGRDHSVAISEWDRVINIPALSLYDLAGDAYPEGQQNLRTIVERRTGTDAFEEDALLALIQASGGIHRDLLTLAQQACLRASVGGRKQVALSDVTAAVEDRRQEVSFHLTPSDLEYLDEVNTTKRMTGDHRALPLLNRNLIVGYHGDWSWFDVHPIVKPLLDDYRRRSRAP